MLYRDIIKNFGSKENWLELSIGFRMKIKQSYLSTYKKREKAKHPFCFYPPYFSNTGRY